MNGGSVLISRVALNTVLREPLEQESQLLAPKFTAVGLSAVHQHPGAQHRLIAADRKSKPKNELLLDGPLLASLCLVYCNPGSKPFIAPDVRVSCLGPIRRTLAVATWRPQPFGGQQQRALWVLGSMALGGPRTLKATRGTIRKAPVRRACRRASQMPA